MAGGGSSDARRGQKPPAARRRPAQARTGMTNFFLSPPGASPASFAHRKNKRERQITLPPPMVSRRSLLQIGHRGQVSRELGDAGRTAPVGACAARIDWSDVPGSGSVERTGEGVAVASRQVGVGGAQ